MPQFNYYGSETTPKPDDYGLIRDDAEADIADKTKQLALRDALMHTLGYYDASTATLSISGSAALSDTDPAIQFASASGSSGVNLSFDTPGNDSHPFVIINSGGSANGAIATNDNDSTVIRPGYARMFFPDGSTNFRVLMGSLIVSEEDGSPSVPDVTTIKFTNGTVTDNGDGSVSVASSGGGGGVGANYILNPEFCIAQRGTSFDSTTIYANNDGNYLFDGSVLLSDGNDIVDVSQETTIVPVGTGSAVKLEVETANKQFGLLWILEKRDSIAFIGGVASISFTARMAAADDNTHSLKAVVLSWDSTVDAPTKDVVSAWSATPTFAANWTAENTASSNTLTTSYQTFTVENISVDTPGTNNIALFIFCDQTDGAIDDAIYITGVKLEPAATATDYVSENCADMLARCKRYYENSIQDGQSVDSVTLQANYVAATSVATSTYYYNGVFTVEKRTTPTVTIRPYTTRTSTNVISNNAGTDLAADSGYPVSISVAGFSLANNSAGAISLPGNIFHYLYEASAELGV